MPFTIIPYTQMFMWSRLEDKAVDDYQWFMAGLRQISFLDYETKVTNNVKTGSVSIIDYI